MFYDVLKDSARLADRWRCATRHQRTDDEPANRKHHEEVRQILAIPAVGSVRFASPVKRLTVREDVRFGQLVEAVNEQLNDEDQQEHRGHLEEQPEIHAMAVSGPERS